MLELLMSLTLANVNPSVLVVPVFPVIEAPLTVPELMAIATSSAARYHLTKRQTDRLLKVVSCESGWVATSTGRLGERGLVQIYPKQHPEITEMQMIDPYFSLDFLAKNLYKHTSWWSCFGLTSS